ncbi:MAG: TIGR02680 family protein [Actinomycetales bacterium]|nr:TIGR02680 family protein [Actinomycetales bacterium]
MTVTELSTRSRPRDRGDGRWQPTRAGILNVWRYYDEVFAFHRGRLLLRGPNGTGKSKALEVLLPFLLDANLRANRLSTFGTSERTMHWNLMGQGATGKTRVGYVWLELCRNDPEPAWFTCGARLQASEHTTTVHSDYFTTSQRVGLSGGLPLLDGQIPLTRSRLEEAIGTTGTVYRSGSDYRAAVRHALFPGLSEQRYDALITALLQLRTPKLSQRLDPGLLSTLLSRALPPLDQDEIAELAEGFERLDRQRERLRRMDEEVRAAETLADRARTYSRRLLRAGAAALVSATTVMDELTRTARLSEESYQRVSAELEAAGERDALLVEQVAELRARIDGLRESDSYREGQELDRLREQVRSAERRAARAEATAERERGQAGTARSAADAAGETAGERGTEEQRTRADVVRLAERVSLSAVAEQVGAEGIEPRTAGLVVRAAVEQRNEQIRRVREALRRHGSAVEARTRAEQDRDDATTAAETATAALGLAQEEQAAALDDQVLRLRRWAAGCAELRLDPEALAAVAGDQRAVDDLAGAAARAVTTELATDEADLRVRRRTRERELGDVRAELARLQAEVDLPPSPPGTRTSDRTRCAGAPLWRLTAFADDVPPSVQAGLEAALEASGLLDAWITPDGTVLDGAGHDTFWALPADAAAGPTLAAVLRPEPGPVPAEVVVRLLRGVAYGASLPGNAPVAVGADGHWRLADLTGSWAKPEALYIGAAARELHRQRQITEVRQRLDELVEAIGIVDEGLAGVAARRDRTDADLAARPDHRRLDRAHQAVTRAETQAESCAARLEECRGRLRQAEAAVTTALRELTGAAAERGLPVDPAALDHLVGALAELDRAVDTWLHTHSAWTHAVDTVRLREESAVASEIRARAADDEATTASAEFSALRARLDAVEGAVAASYREVLAELSRSRVDLEQTERSAADTRRVIAELQRRAGELDSTRRNDQVRGEQATAARNEAARRFRALCAGTLAEDAVLPTPGPTGHGVRETLDAARAVAAAWATVPHEPRNITEALSRLSDTMYRSQETLAQRTDLELVTEDDVQVLTASVDGLRGGAARLLQALRAERARSSEDITAAEHELFDTTLTGDTRRHLADRIRQAGALVDDMNARLDRVRTASRVAVRLTWQVDPTLPPGTRAARELLLRDPSGLGDADRQALHTFLRQRIEEARAAQTAASWQEQLGEVFDYTAWHRFVVKVDRADGLGWQELTRKLHGALSGGEKAIALHLPLFAAVAAHYQAVPGAPRLILLDEVFVGVDVANRGQVFALLAALDLDLVLTSDHEWCRYRELDGIAVHQLVTGEDGDDAVTTVRFTWDGRGLVASPERRESSPTGEPDPDRLL